MTSLVAQWEIENLERRVADIEALTLQIGNGYQAMLLEHDMNKQQAMLQSILIAEKRRDNLLKRNGDSVPLLLQEIKRLQGSKT